MNIAAVILAAGASQRFGTQNKLLADLGGKPMIRRVAEEFLRSGAETIVVTGCDRPLVERALESLPLRFAHNANWTCGMGSSIAAGIMALGRETQGAFIAPGDMPFLTSALIKDLIAAFKVREGKSIIYPATRLGEQRNPVLWPREFFALLASLSGSEGAKKLLADVPDSQKQALVVAEGAFVDVDFPEDLEAARSRWQAANT